MMKSFFLFLIGSVLSSVVLASEKSLYDFQWLDKDKEIYVLQNRRFRKDGKLYIGGNAVKTISGAFVDSYGVSARGGYFFSEDWGLEFAYGKNSGQENDTAKGVKEQGTVPFYRKIDTYVGAMAVWSPFYSKINTFNKVFYFDWMLGLGIASIKTLDNRMKFASPPSGTLTSENNMGAIWNTGFRFYINDSWSVRLDLTGLNYKASKSRKVQGSSSGTTSDTFYSNLDFGLGLNFTF